MKKVIKDDGGLKKTKSVIDKARRGNKKKSTTNLPWVTEIWKKRQGVDR